MFLENVLFNMLNHVCVFRIIAKGAGGGLGSRGLGSSRGALAISVFELHKDERIYVLVGQKGENACVKSFMQRDDDCDSIKNGQKSSSSNSKTKQVKDILPSVLDDGTGGGGGGATFIFLLNSANTAVPLLVAAGGGGLGVGHFIQDNQQHGRINDNTRMEISGTRHGDANVTGGAGIYSCFIFFLLVSQMKMLFHAMVLFLFRWRLACK